MKAEYQSQLPLQRTTKHDLPSECKDLRGEAGDSGRISPKVETTKGASRLVSSTSGPPERVPLRSANPNTQQSLQLKAPLHPTTYHL